MIFQDGEVLVVLQKLSIIVERERGEEVICYCPGHELRTGRQDNNPSWSINVSSGVHHCFSCGYKGNLITLVAEQLEFISSWGMLNLDEAKTWLRNNTKVDLEVLVKQMAEMKDAYISIPKPVEMSEARLAIYSKPTEWALKQRSVTEEACEKYGVLWDESIKSWILPIRNPENNKLLGWQEKGQGSRYFKNRPTGVTKSSTLFGIDAWTSGQMIVVESPLDAVLLESAGISGGVACYGASLSTTQLQLVRRADRLIIAFDNPRLDTAGRAGSMKMLEYSKKNGVECLFLNYDGVEAKDIGDMTNNEIYKSVSTAKHCVLGKAAIGA